MSLAELKAAASKLGVRQRQELRLYLAALDRQRDAGWRASMNARLAKLKSGEGVTEHEYRRRTSLRRPRSTR
jgi:hypothetical protein